MSDVAEPARATAKKMMPKEADAQQGDIDAELRSAICICLIAERREGATIGELAQLTLGGRTPSEEVTHISTAVSELVRAGEVTMEEGKVVPVVTETIARRLGGSNGR